MIELKEKLFTDEIKRLRPVIGAQTSERLSRAYLIGDETTRKRIVEMLDMLKAAVMSDSELRDSPLTEPPTLSGDIPIGHLLYGNKVAGELKWNEDTFITHVGIFGSSGYGKTNLSYSIVRSLSDKGVPVVILDFSKKNYRDLLQTELRDRIDVYTLGADAAPLHFNPLKPPPGVSKTQWAKEFAEIFDHAYWLLGGGKHIVLKSLSQLYEKMDKPVLLDLKNHIESYNGLTTRERNWVSTSMRPLESLCMKETGDIFSLADGTRPSAFFEPGKITILEMDALSTNDRMFFIEILMQWIRDWLLAEGTREKLEGVIIIEEAHHILNREKAKKIGSETVMDLVFREMRELGLGIVYLDQHPSMVSYPALGNTSTHVYMNLGLDTRYSSDVQDAASMLGIDDEDQAHLRMLPVGNAFVLMRHSSWPRPFNAKFPLFPIKKGLVKDSEIAQYMRHKIVHEPLQIEDLHMEIVKLIGSGEGVFTSQLYKPLKISGGVFKEKISSLVKSGVIGVREVRLEKTKANYYYLTDAGEKLLAEKFPKVSGKSREFLVIDTLKGAFSEMGWKYSQNKKSSNEFSIEAAGKGINLIVLQKHNRPEIEKSVVPGCYYICATPEIRNILLQCAAKNIRDEKTKISCALVEDFPGKGFEDYVF